MSRRLRGTVQEPMDDYHDTARTGHEIGRPVEILAKDDGTAEKTNSHLSNESPINGQESVMNESTSHQPPAGWSPEYDQLGTVLYYDGPSATVGNAAIFTDWTPGQGITIRDSTGHEIPLDDLLPFACRVLKVHSAVLAARREVAS